MTLAPVPGSEIKAIYNSRAQCIEIIAKGRLPGNYHGLSFEQQERWDSILLFSLSAQTYSFGHDYTKPYEAKYRLLLRRPQTSSSNKSVLVQTAQGTWEVPVQHDNSPAVGSGARSPSSRSPVLGPSVNPSLASIRPRTPSIRPHTPSERPHTPSERPYSPAERPYSPTERPHSPSENRLQPIRKAAGEGQIVTIQADIPDATSDVWPMFDLDEFRIISTSVNHSVITWIFQWVKPPVQGKGTQEINIHTRSQRTGPKPIIQKYLVEGTYTKVRAKAIPRFRRHDMIFSEPLCV